jgi:hypothetical protein
MSATCDLAHGMRIEIEEVESPHPQPLPTRGRGARGGEEEGP